TAPLTKPVQRNFARRRQCLDAEVGPARVLENAEGIAGLSEEAAAFPCELPAMHVQEPNMRRQRMPCAEQSCDGRAHVGVVVGCGPNIVAVDAWVLVSGQREVDALAVSAAGVFVGDAANNRIAVSLLREFGQKRA